MFNIYPLLVELLAIFQKTDLKNYDLISRIFIEIVYQQQQS